MLTSAGIWSTTLGDSRASCVITHLRWIITHQNTHYIPQNMQFIYAYSSGALCNMGYPPETHLKLKSREISLAHNSRFSYPIVAHSTGMILPHSVQNFERIGQLRNTLWVNEILRDLDDYFPGTGTIVELPQFRRSNPDMGKVGTCRTTTKLSKLRTPCLPW